MMAAYVLLMLFKCNVSTMYDRTTVLTGTSLCEVALCYELSETRRVYNFYL